MQLVAPQRRLLSIVRPPVRRPVPAVLRSALRSVLPEPVGVASGSKCTFVHGETFAEPDANQEPDHDNDAGLAVFRQLRKGRGSSAMSRAKQPLQHELLCKAQDYDASRDNSWLGEVVQSGEGTSANGSFARCRSSSSQTNPAHSNWTTTSTASRPLVR